MIIIRHGEIFTKSDPVRKEFISKLVKNIQEALPNAKIIRKKWRIYVDSDSDEDVKVLQRVFGIVSLSKSIVTDADIEKIKEVVAKEVVPKVKEAKTFGVNAKRITKSFPLTSQEIGQEVGGFIHDQTNTKVQLKNPEVQVNIEIYEDKAFIFYDFVLGPGGLPLGTVQGLVTSNFENDNDLIAAWMLMKRGAIVVPFQEKLKHWSYGFKDKGEILAKVTGITDVDSFNKYQKSTDLPVFSPLIGFTEEELENLKKRVLS